jgi:hypothetical protein
MGVTQKSTGFVIGDSAKPLAALADNGDNKPFLGIYGGGGSSALLSAGYQPDGKLAFRVGESSKPVAVLGQGGSSSGSLQIYGGSGGGKPLITLEDPNGSSPGLRVMSSNGQPVVIAGAKSDGSGGALRVLAKGQLAGGVDAMPDGSGDVYVTGGGKVIAEMRSEGGKGLVAIYQGGPAVAHMGVGSGGGGNFTAADPGGTNVFSAGYEPDGPGSVCVDHKGAKCLGVGLTGMEGFH